MSKKRRVPALIILFALLLVNLAAVLIFGADNREITFTGKAAEICEALEAEGFPHDYAVELTKLSLLHPTWKFLPLNVTQTNEEYTWDYVIARETENAETNLVLASESYSDYWHPLNRELYDAGFYQASALTVQYFMDPRGFLNEADIFQFYDLASSENASADAVKAVLAGTFMENKNLMNGKTYADYLVEIGAEIGIDPVYLAVKLRQEQGVDGTSPIISGTCGDLLLRYYTEKPEKTESGKPVNAPESGLTEQELLDLNGLYNPFNVSASGSGLFNIYKNAMDRAKLGTASMRNEWGSPSWDADWKGLYGGALFIKSKYIDQYQSTVYLQKFNVDGRIAEKNFWSQYMQNVGGALTEGRSFYQSFATNNALDAGCRFLIPIYEGMPSRASADPANGKCSAFAAATDKFQTSAHLSAPLNLRDENEALYGDISVAYGTSLSLFGDFSHSYGIAALEYAWDGGDWTQCAQGSALELTFSENLPAYGEHMLVIRGVAEYDAEVSTKKANRYFLCVVLTVNVMPPPSVTLTLKNDGATSEAKHYEGATVSLPEIDDRSFAGWLGSDGSFLPSGGSFLIETDLTYTALYLSFEALEGAALSATDAPHLRFQAVVLNSDYEAITEHMTEAISFSAELFRNSTLCEQSILTAESRIVSADGKIWRLLSFCTPELSQKELEDRFSTDFKATISYSDGTQRILRADKTTSTRSAVQVAWAALADTSVSYSDETLARLRAIVS